LKKLCDENVVIVYKISSYDIIGDPGFSDAKMVDQREILRKKLLKKRREKINRLDSLTNR
jgi:hypothetical protein